MKFCAHKYYPIINPHRGIKIGRACGECFKVEIKVREFDRSDDYILHRMTPVDLWEKLKKGKK